MNAPPSYDEIQAAYAKMESFLNRGALRYQIGITPSDVMVLVLAECIGRLEALEKRCIGSAWDGISTGQIQR